MTIGALHTNHRGDICIGIPGAGNLGESQLVLVHSVRWRKPAAIGLHGLVPDGRHSQEIRRWCAFSLTPQTSW